MTTANKIGAQYRAQATKVGPCATRPVPPRDPPSPRHSRRSCLVLVGPRRTPGQAPQLLLQAEARQAEQPRRHRLVAPGPLQRGLDVGPLGGVDGRAQAEVVAGALVAAMEDAVRGAGGGHIRVETSETEGYGAARRLYEKLGYPLAARMRDFYGPGDALLVYYKDV